ncbi:MAG: hypothetical protein U1E35_04780 [Rhodospirillales bacterium]
MPARQQPSWSSRASTLLPYASAGTALLRYQGTDTPLPIDLADAAARPRRSRTCTASASASSWLAVR